MNKYLIIIAVLVLSGCERKFPDPCTDGRIDRYERGIARHEECRSLENCIFDQTDIYHYQLNKEKLAACEAREVE